MRLPVSIRSGAAFLPIICRDRAGGAGYGGVMLLKGPEMSEVIGLGRRQPDGGKVVKLRKRLGMKQEELANRAHISVRHLREIERTNKSVPGTTITAIATVLKVTPEELTLPTQDDNTNDTDDTDRYQQLKLRAVRSAHELSSMAEQSHIYHWDLSVDPTTVAAKEMQQVLGIVRRLVEHLGATDEFDLVDATGRPAEYPEDFGYITRLARLQELLDTLGTRGVGVLAASYWTNRLASAEDKGPGPKLPIPGKSEQVLKFEGILEIRFVPFNVNEQVITIDTGLPENEIESLFH